MFEENEKNLDRKELDKENLDKEHLNKEHLNEETLVEDANQFQDNSKESSDSKEFNSKESNDSYEKVCYVCRRPESKAGKMISMLGNIEICNDCMQRAFDQVEKSGFSYPPMMGMAFPPNMNIKDFDMEQLSDMIPNRQRVKKKKPKDEKEVKKEFDIRSIPAPHKINAKLNEFVVGHWTFLRKPVFCVYCGIWSVYRGILSDSSG